MSLRENDFISKDIEIVNTVAKVLQQMNKGTTVEIDGQHFKLAQTDDCMGFCIMMRLEQQCGNEISYIWLGVDFAVFCDYVKKLSFDDIFLLCANTALKDINKRG